ncbi:hypothetical protein FHX37_4410 [Haloactinospora alba]|uniref:Uncharacterized protein n=1 Tax=Haloactinospora alba TaxID=405555 RepID=A0A543N777_9ACTN|nr:hypothetical protein [Haloactinospora alba]TQN27684.1 hypothetical protein FHX37_4410 [Haloactinospora alba]
MRRTTKIAGTVLVSVALLGLGSAGAAANAHSGSEAYQACIEKQQTSSLLAVNLDLLNQCIANYND